MNRIAAAVIIGVVFLASAAVPIVAHGSYFWLAALVEEMTGR